MTSVYAIALGLGLVALIVLILGSAYATNVGRQDRDINRRIGKKGRMILAGVLGFGMGGIAADFSPLGLGEPLTMILALLAAVAAVAWVHFRGSAPGA